MCVCVCSSEHVSCPVKGPASAVCMPETLTKRMTPSRKAFPPNYRCILSEVCACFHLFSSFWLKMFVCLCCDAAMPCFCQMLKFTNTQTLFKGISSFHLCLLKFKKYFHRLKNCRKYTNVLKTRLI